MALSEAAKSRLTVAGLWLYALALAAATANQFLDYPVWKPPLDRMAIGLVENLRDLREIRGGEPRAALRRVYENVRRARIEKDPVEVEQSLADQLAKEDSPTWSAGAEALHKRARDLSVEWLKEMGDFVVVPLLVDALGADSEAERGEAYKLLLALTEDMPGRPKPDAYAASAAAPFREAAIQAWKDWVKRNKENL